MLEAIDRPIALMNVSKKIIEAIMAKRLEKWYEGIVGQHQVGFVRSRQLGEHVATMRVLSEQERTADRHATTCFLDLRAAYDLVNREILYDILFSYGVPTDLILLMQALHRSSTTRVRVADQFSGPVHLLTGLQQGSPLSPMLFNVYLEAILQ